MNTYHSYQGAQSFLNMGSIPAYKTPWGIALLVSLSLHAAFLISSGGNVGIKLDKPQQQTAVTWLNIEHPKVKTAPAPQKKKHVQTKIKPVQQVQHAPTVKSVTKPIVKNKAQPKQVATNQQPPAHIAQHNATAKPALRQGFLQQQEQRYFAEVMQHIAQFKRYPKSAKRRGIEGNIPISFVIQANGMLSHIHISQGHPRLQKAARKALRQAQPLPIPPQTLEKELHFTLSMQFVLQE